MNRIARRRGFRLACSSSLFNILFSSVYPYGVEDGRKVPFFIRILFPRRRLPDKDMDSLCAHNPWIVISSSSPILAVSMFSFSNRTETPSIFSSRIVMTHS